MKMSVARTPTASISLRRNVTHISARPIVFRAAVMILYSSIVKSYRIDVLAHIVFIETTRPIDVPREPSKRVFVLNEWMDGVLDTLHTVPTEQQTFVLFSYIFISSIFQR